MADFIVEQLTGRRNEQDEILWKFLAGLISTQNAAEMLASAILAGDLEHGLNVTWGTVILPAIRESSDQRQIVVVDLLVHMANLPSARDVDGQQLKVHDMLLWGVLDRSVGGTERKRRLLTRSSTLDDLPMFGWEMNDEWNRTFSKAPAQNTLGNDIFADFGLPKEGPNRQKMINEFVNVNKCAARLMKTGTPVFLSFDIFGLWTMREILETPIEELDLEHSPPEAGIPAAAAWISIVGEDMYSWDKEFPYGSLIGDMGGGGLLWNGQHGFCKERWQLWRSRFGKLSSSEKLSEELREVCKEAQTRMSEIEAQSA